MPQFRSAGVVGCGAIGAGWVARLVANEIDVRVYDEAPGADERLERVLANSRRAWCALTDAPPRKEGSVRIVDSVARAVTDADLVVESVPERLDTKRAVYAEIEAHAPADAILTSSTSGLLPSELQAEMTHPERFVVAHPFHPVYLLPLVEIVAGGQTSEETASRIASFFEAIGMRPLRVRREIEGFIADRLLEAMWREALWLIHDGVATTSEVDDAMRYGFGLRAAQMGLFETYRIAGGEAGMRHFLAQFGPCLEWPWTKLVDVPDLDDALIDRIAEQSDEQSGRHLLEDLERIRDDNLVAILRGLRGNEWAAGETLAEYEARLTREAESRKRR